MKITREREWQTRSRTVTIELGVDERFEISEYRYRRQPQRTLALAMHLTWERDGIEEYSYRTKWSVEVANILKDESLGARKTFSDWRVDQPEPVTKALADLAPEWYE